MTIASAQTLRQLQPVIPFVERSKSFGMTYGVGPAGYDIRIAQDVTLFPGDFILASSIERFRMPENVLGVVHDKSTWARQGLSVFNTVIEPGWHGFLTLELKNLQAEGVHQENYLYGLHIKVGMPIAQVVFHLLDSPTDTPYVGKYQAQGDYPQEAIFEQ